ncbi:MAG: integrase [Methanomicrobiales archaeon HGW-Methanomicrobiales-4]|nr:MAG: integrase [Methanomicrobiales archaeon HGW-Methanomicrobiales-4]
MTPQSPESERFHGNPSDRPDPIPIAVASGLITEKDAELIKTYVYEHSTSANISKVASLQLTRLLITSRKWSGPYSGATVMDLYKIVDGVKTGLSKNNKPFSEQTQREYITRMKAFFLWLVENGESQIPEKKINAVKPPVPFMGIKNASNLLSPDEILEILNAFHSSRDRAMFTMLYEGGFRVGEVGTLKWENVQFDSAGVVVNIVYKTKKPRYVRLIMCKNALAAWKADYPGDPSGEAYVFVNNRNEMNQYHGVKKILERALAKTTITKKVNLHLIRHSRVTHLIQEGVSESVIKMVMWGSVNARSFATYAHLTGTDVDREMCKLYGIETVTADKKERSLTPMICPRCKEICGPTCRFCSSCGQPLNIDTINEYEDLQDWLMKNKVYLAAFLNKMDAIPEIDSPKPKH